MDKEYWFTKKSKQFLKNIDTFYYAVFFDADFTRKSQSHAVEKLRVFCDKLKYEYEDKECYFGGDDSVLYQPGTFSIYGYRFTAPEFFDFFVAPITRTEETPHAVMQIRSRALWEDGVYAAIDESFAFVETFAAFFGLKVREIRENRCDFACHSNYLNDPESFFERDHFVKMWCGKLGRTKEGVKHMYTHTTVYYDDTTETDYLAIGRRGDKCFLRVYLKSKEVIQEGYKGFFLKIWLDEGLISRYDLYCLEEAYKQKKWSYVDIARLKWVLEYDDTVSPVHKDFIKSVIEADKIDINLVHKTAKTFSKPITKIFNVEFQCMRDMSKTFELIKEKKNQGSTKRVMDYLDNYDLIYDYLTSVTFRLVRTDDPDTHKDRRKNCEFWERLRNSKAVDFKKEHKGLKLLRKYTSNVNLEVRKQRAVNALSSFGYAYNQNSDGTIMDDAATLLSILNDNDLAAIDKHKKKMAARNAEVIPDEQKRHRSVLFLYDPDNGTFY